MKLSFLLLTIAFLQVAAKTNSQTITFSGKNVKLETVFAEIKKQTGFVFFYSSQDIEKAKPVSIHMVNASVEEAFRKVMANQPLTYTIKSNTVFIRAKLPVPTIDPPTIVTAPGLSIAGKVTNQEGEPLQGATVNEAGTSNMILTNKEGNFYINVKSEQSKLVISYVGFDAKEIIVGDQTSVTVSLVQSSSKLNDIVLIGYGSQRRRDLTGAVSSVDMKQLEGTPLRSADQALQGRVAGVFFVQNSGMPGAGSSVRVRGGNSINGSNEPLYVVDGIPVLVNTSSDGFSLNPLNAINPADIKSIEVLKDASSTAIYGSRGGNGVVLITTNRGSKGKLKVNASFYTGWQKETNRYELLNAKQFETLANDASVAEGGPLLYDPALNPVSTDWQGELFNTYAPTSNYHVSASGGNEVSQYMASFTYFNQKGIIRSSDLDRFSLQLNSDHKLSEKVKMGNNLTISNVVTNRVNSGSLFSMLTTAPNLPVRQPDGSFTQFNNLGIGFNNPVALLEGYTNKDENFRALGNAFASIEPIKGLVIKTMWGLDAIFVRNDSYTPKSVYTGQLVGGSASVSTSRNLVWLNENTVTYNRSFGIHKIDLLGGLTQQSANFKSLGASATGFLNDNTTTNNLGLGNPDQAELPASSSAGWTLRSWLGRINYNLNSKYLVTLTGRYDGSSRFGKNNRWGFFPSAAVAWRAGDEKFIQDLNVFSDLKIRASYGVTGNQEGIGNYPALDLWGPSNYILNGQVATGITPTQTANQNLKWESTLQADIGIEFGFFNNRLSFVVDAYHKRTQDLLLEVTVPASSGFLSGTKNIGSLENKGIEVTINGTPVKNDLVWNTSLNISWNRNKILDLGVEDEIIPSGLTTALLKVGEPVGNFLGYITTGLFQSQEEIMNSAQPNTKPGDRRYVDFNTDGIINALDRRVMGNAQPVFYGGLNNSLTYKNFDLSFFLQFVYGNEIYNTNLQTLENLTGLQNQRATVLDRWTPKHPNTNIPRATNIKPDLEAHNYYVEDGSYLRLKNLQLAYNIPSGFLNFSKLRSLRVFINTQNLLTLTNYSGMDPEVSRYASDNVRQGYDSGSYPNVKTITFGVNVGF